MPPGAPPAGGLPTPKPDFDVETGNAAVEIVILHGRARAAAPGVARRGRRHTHPARHRPAGRRVVRRLRPSPPHRGRHRLPVEAASVARGDRRCPQRSDPPRLRPDPAQPLPDDIEEWHRMIGSALLTPPRRALARAAALGISVGRALVASREREGMNPPGQGGGGGATCSPTSTPPVRARQHGPATFTPGGVSPWSSPIVSASTACRSSSRRRRPRRAPLLPGW